MGVFSWFGWEVHVVVKDEVVQKEVLRTIKYYKCIGLAMSLYSCTE